MDVPRPSQAKAKARKRLYLIGGAVIAFALITFALSRLKPAAPTVERNLVWMGTVERGEMLRQVRGLGTLVPEDIRWVAARTQGRVERIVLRPGALVEAESVILILANPDVERAADEADSLLKGAEAELINRKIDLESGVLAAEASAAQAKAQYEISRLTAEVNEQMNTKGLVTALDLKKSQVTANQLGIASAIEEQRYQFARNSVPSQLAIKSAEVDRHRALAKIRHDELEALQVKAGMDGVLQLLPVEVGSQVSPGTNLARVADPARLKAEIRVAETQAKDIQIGQSATIDTRNGLIDGRVSRIDPSVQNGTVTVDVTFTSELPRGARPDLSVDGTIELERLPDVLNVGRPAFGQENSRVSLFKLDPDGVYANRIQVELGRSSVNKIEIREGLQSGDKIILSDMSQ
jgi:HlyD family secretion protein